MILLMQSRQSSAIFMIVSPLNYFSTYAIFVSAACPEFFEWSNTNMDGIVR